MSGKWLRERNRVLTPIVIGFCYLEYVVFELVKCPLSQRTGHVTMTPNASRSDFAFQFNSHHGRHPGSNVCLFSDRLGSTDMFRNLLKEMIPIMNPDDDFMTIVSAEQKIAASWARRKKEIEKSEAHLNGTPRTLHILLKHNQRVFTLSSSPQENPRTSQNIINTPGIRPITRSPQYNPKRAGKRTFPDSQADWGTRGRDDSQGSGTGCSQGRGAQAGGV